MDTIFFKKNIERWDSFESLIGGIFLTVSALIILLEVILRMVFHSTIVGSDEIACFVVIWSVFFTASIGVKTGVHVRIDLFLRLMPPKLRLIMEIIGTIATALFCLYFTYSGIYLVQEAIQVGDRTVGTIRTPLWLPQLIMPFGGMLLFFRIAGKAVQLIRTYSRDKKVIDEAHQSAV